MKVFVTICFGLSQSNNQNCSPFLLSQDTIMLSLIVTPSAIALPFGPYYVFFRFPTWLCALQVYQTHQVGQAPMLELVIFGYIPPNYLCFDI